MALAVALLVVFRWRRAGFDWDLFTSTLLGMRWGWLAAAIVIAFATYYGRALRWAVMIKHVKPNPNLWGLFSSTVIGFTAIVIFGRPGELVRPYLISIKERVSFSSQLAAWMLERICDLLSALLIFAFALVQVGRSGAKVGPTIQWAMRTGGYVAGVVGLLSVLVIFLLRQFSSQMQQRILGGLEILPERWRPKMEELVTSFVLGVESTRRRSGLLWLFLYTVLEWGLITLCYLALFRSFPALANLGFTDAFILIGFVAFGSLVQIPGVGGGVQVVSIVVLTEIFRLPLEIATGMALVIWCVTFVVIVPLGLLLLLDEGINWRKFIEMEGTTRI